MSTVQHPDEPIAHAYQVTRAMPAVGIRASDWVVYRPTASAAPGDLIFAKYDGVVGIGRLLCNAEGDLVYRDGATGEVGLITRPHQLRVFGVVIAVRGDGVFH